MVLTGSDINLDDQGRHVIVCDNGTGLVKVGYAKTESPNFIFPSIVGRPQLKKKKIKNQLVELKDVMCGFEAEQAREFLDISYPMEKGQIQNWEDMEHLWEYTFGPSVMNIDPSNSKIFLTEPPGNHANDRKKMFERMFERFNVAATNCSLQAMLALCGTGLTTGVVLDSGDGVSHVSVINHNLVIPLKGRSSMHIAGRDVTRHLIKILGQRGYVFNNLADFETIKKMKEQVAYTAYDISEENHLADKTTVLCQTYSLPDGRNVKIGRERFECSEILFQPYLMGREGVGVSELLFEAITDDNIDLSCRKDCFANIVLLVR